MTQAEFLEILETTPRDWIVNSNGHIRTTDYRHCPVTAVRLKHGTLPLPASRLAGSIMTVADVRNSGPLRKALLKACGLKGVA